MLIKWIKNLFKKYIYSPHVHKWTLQDRYQSTTRVGGISATGTKSIYVCECGKLQQIN